MCVTRLVGAVARSSADRGNSIDVWQPTPSVSVRQTRGQPFQVTGTLDTNVWTIEYVTDPNGRRDVGPLQHKTSQIAPTHALDGTPASRNGPDDAATLLWDQSFDDLWTAYTASRLADNPKVISRAAELAGTRRTYLWIMGPRPLGTLGARDYDDFKSRHLKLPADYKILRHSSSAVRAANGISPLHVDRVKGHPLPDASAPLEIERLKDIQGSWSKGQAAIPPPGESHLVF